VSDESDLAWAAGFFDGEGTVGYTEAGGYVGVSIEQISLEPLRLFRDVVGVGHFNGPYVRGGNGRWTKREIYYFKAYRQAEVIRVVRALWPYLGTIKQAQALDAMRQCPDWQLDRCTQ
jgi:hypothetical protein